MRTRACTFENCRTRWQPTVSLWGTYQDWEEVGRPDALATADRRVKEILESAPDGLIDPELDRDLKRYVGRGFRRIHGVPRRTDAEQSRLHI